jgi:hypothetical protein
MLSDLGYLNPACNIGQAGFGTDSERSRFWRSQESDGPVIGQKRAWRRSQMKSVLASTTDMQAVDIYMLQPS